MKVLDILFIPVAVFTLLFVLNAIYIQVITKTAVIAPSFTYSAYLPNGFYYHYIGNCSGCLTVPIIAPFDDLNLTAKYGGSYNAWLIATLMGFRVVTDEQVNQDPSSLAGHRLIVLHNEYVTQSEFNLINSSAHVVYYYPNAMLAKVSYSNNTITLLSGHVIDGKENAFGWVYDNTNQEHTKCPYMGQHYRHIANGIQYTCWTQDPIKIFGDLLYLEFKRT